MKNKPKSGAPQKFPNTYTKQMRVVRVVPEEIHDECKQQCNDLITKLQNEYLTKSANENLTK